MFFVFKSLAGVHAVGVLVKGVLNDVVGMGTYKARGGSGIGVTEFLPQSIFRSFLIRRRSLEHRMLQVTSNHTLERDMIDISFRRVPYAALSSVLFATQSLDLSPGVVIK